MNRPVIAKKQSSEAPHVVSWEPKTDSCERNILFFHRGGTGTPGTLKIRLTSLLIRVAFLGGGGGIGLPARFYMGASLGVNFAEGTTAAV